MTAATVPHNSIGLMFAVAFWNDYTHYKLYITNADLYNFQMKLRSVIMGSDLPGATGAATENTVKNAAVMVAIIPFMIIYPFCQKYFVTGVYLVYSLSVINWIVVIIIIVIIIV